MSKKKTQKKKKKSTMEPKAPPAPVRPSSGVTTAGLVALALSVAASVMLVLQHFTSMALPGCGAGSGCAELTAGVWGKVPGIDLPVSFVGLAYFVAAAIGWIVARRDGLSSRFLWIIRLGALASVVFVIVMVAKLHFCIYCTAAHVGNLAFWLLAERATRPRAMSWLQPATVTAVFVVATAVLFGADMIWAKRVRDDAEQQRADSARRIIDADTVAPGEAFTGRYRTGPEEAAIRIVAFSDYQCPDCRRIEKQARQLLASRDDVSLSAKHFPMCNDCNKYMGRTNMHPNACWAARAAETAGKLRGNEGFWEMHQLLFDREGSFTDQELRQILTDLGYDVNEFLSIMQSQEILRLVEQDIEEAKALGLHFTPMVFVNGVEMKGFMAPNALINTVNEVTAASPPLRTAEFDQPPMAAEKYVDDWRDEPARFISGLDEAWTRGPSAAKVHVIVWSDLSSSFTAALDAEIRALMERRGDVKYSFLNYPIDQACNPQASTTQSAVACLASQAAEAAGLLEGSNGFWRMYDWILAHQNDLSQASIAAAAGELDFDAESLLSAMQSSEVQAAIRDDANTGARSGVRRFIPAVYVNTKWVPRWRLEGYDILGNIVEEASR